MGKPRKNRRHALPKKKRQNGKNHKFSKHPKHSKGKVKPSD